MSTSSQNPSWSPESKRVVAVIGLIAILLLIYISRSVAPLLIWAAILAYIFQPLVALLARLRVPRGVGALLSILLLLLLLALGPILLTPVVADQLATIEVDFSDLGNRLLSSGQALLARYPRLAILGYQIDLQATVQQGSDYLLAALPDVQLPGINEIIDYLLQGLRTASGLLGTATGLATEVAVAVVASGIAAVFLFMYTFYLTKDGPRLRAWLLNLAPAAHQPEMEELLERIARTWAAFFRGQLLLSATIAIVTTIALALIGMPGALILGLIAGLLEVVPSLGPLLAMIPALILALVQGSLTLNVANWAFALITLGVYLVIQQLENTLIVPRIMGQSLNLHPMLVLVGIVVGASTAGLLGAFLAAPTLATLRLAALYVHAKLLDREPFPQPSPADRAAAGRAGQLRRLIKRLAAGPQDKEEGPPAAATESTEERS